MGKAKGAKPLYLHADAKVSLDLPGVKTHVLGPPTLEQSDAIRKMRSADDVEFWMLLGATGTRFTASGGAPFPGRDCVDGARIPDHARWLRDHNSGTNVFQNVSAGGSTVTGPSRILCSHHWRERTVFLKGSETH